MKCAFCGHTLKPTAAWRGSSGSFYCNEFCADMEPIDLAVADHVMRGEQHAPEQPATQPSIPFP